MVSSYIQNAAQRAGIVQPIHPLARPGNSTGFGTLVAGERVRHALNGATGRADEFLPDGDALVRWDDGSCDAVRAALLLPMIGAAA